MSSYHPVGTRMTAKYPSEAFLFIILDAVAFPFAKLIDKLFYCTNYTRPDICTAISNLSRHMSSPTQLHRNQAKRVIRYFAGTKYYCLTFIDSNPCD